MATSTASTVERASARDRILAAANQLFYREGIHTVGVDRIIDEAGVAKASLYSSFKGGKAELVRAYLEGRRESLMATITAAIARHDEPRERLLAVFEAQGEIAARPGYNGCAFAAATSEAHGEGVDEVVQAHRTWMRTTLVTLATEAGASDPDALAGQLQMLYDGATTSAKMDGDLAAASRAAAIAGQLIDVAVASRQALSGSGWPGRYGRTGEAAERRVAQRIGAFVGTRIL